MKPDLSVNIGKLQLKNPVMSASGTFGYGEEFGDLVSLSSLGAIVVKAVTLNPTPGNPPPRLVEVTGGVINSIGLQNDGVDSFIKNKIPLLKEYGVPVIVNIAGSSVKEYKELAERLNDIPSVSAIEINISCPNIKEGGVSFGTDPKWTGTIVKNVRGATKKIVITKLTPNAADVVKIAKVCEDSGSDAVSLVNTFKAMAIDIEERRPLLGTVTGGLSGPCIKPIALRMVWEVSANVDIPVIGMGGIVSGTDALEFLIAGATCVAVGTANFTNPRAIIDIISGIEDYLRVHNIASVREIIGTLK